MTDQEQYQEVKEAIVEEIARYHFRSQLRKLGFDDVTFDNCEQQERQVYIDDAKDELEFLRTLTYPSGHPMLAVLREDQTLPEHPPLSPEAIAEYGELAGRCRVAGYEQAKIDMKDWRAVLLPERK